jgi:hypothetical protein
MFVSRFVSPTQPDLLIENVTLAFASLASGGGRQFCPILSRTTARYQPNLKSCCDVVTATLSPFTPGPAVPPGVSRAAVEGCPDSARSAGTGFCGGLANSGMSPFFAVALNVFGAAFFLAGFAVSRRGLTAPAALEEVLLRRQAKAYF